MDSDRLIYRDNDDVIWKLSNERKLRCHFSPTTLFPSVDLYTLEDGDTSWSERHCVRVYATEFERFETAIKDFTDYLHWGRWTKDDFIKPSVMVKVDEAMPSRLSGGEAFLIDCSRSYLWLLVRFKSNGPSCERPKTVMDKEMYFPIRLAFHAGDLWLLQDVLKLINWFFSKAKEAHKMTLLNDRLVVGNNLCTKDPRRIPLVHTPSAGSTLFPMQDKPVNVNSQWSMFHKPGWIDSLKSLNQLETDGT